MSFDLEHWYLIKDKKGAKPTKLFLEPPGANFSEYAMRMQHWEADEKFTFEEQVELALEWCEPHQDPDVIARFRQDAKDFRKLADERGYIIKSEWM